MAVLLLHVSSNSLAAFPFHGAFFGAGSGPIYLDNVACQGEESSLLDCQRNPIGEHNCDNSEDAGVSCESSGLTLFQYMSCLISVCLTSMSVHLSVSRLVS